MKYVCLVRHAKAEKTRTDDKLRSLTPEGKQEAAFLGESLKNDGFSCGMLISSDAARSFETAVIIAEKIGIKKRKIRIENSLYQGTGTDTYYRILKDLDNSIETVIITGHNTTLDSAASDMCSDYNRRMTTAAAVCISFPGDNWDKITSKTGSLHFYKFNSRKKKLMKDEKKYIKLLQKNILLQIEKILKSANNRLMLNNPENDIKSIMEHSAKIISNSTIVTITDLNDLNHNIQEK
ncbi:MAG: histidine phosphatase family protein [Spirochaetes bacterium]|nr:histidine phosphatase family protein [Spirochaetota bacterium]